MPPAARVTDMHVCPMVTVLVPHVGGPILPPGAPTVLIEFLPAATVTNMATCVGPPDVIILGSMGVLINFLPAARMGDMTAHGGVIVLGAPTCIIGEVGMPAPGTVGLGGITAGLVAAGLSAVGSSAESAALAAGVAGAGNTQDVFTTRMQTAKTFYSQTGWPTEKITQHLRGIDFSKPVEVVTVPPPNDLKQWVDPKAGVGHYFDADSSPEELGVYPTDVFPRDLKTFACPKVQVLKSIAAPMLIDWLPAPPVLVKGGGTQLFMLPADKAALLPKGVPK